MLAQDRALKHLVCVECWVDTLLMSPVAACSVFPSLLSKISQVQLVMR